MLLPSKESSSLFVSNKNSYQVGYYSSNLNAVAKKHAKMVIRFGTESRVGTRECELKSVDKQHEEEGRFHHQSNTFKVRLDYSSTIFLQAGHVTADMQWLIMFPFYRLAMNHQAPSIQCEPWWIYDTLNEFSMRLYFCWLTGATIFSIIDTLQNFSGSYLSLTVFTYLVAELLTLVFKAYSSSRDLAVATVAIVGLSNREPYFNDAAQRHLRLRVLPRPKSRRE
ncbi:unnamed protein product [Phytophthora lilii]|uniref:Unnamed protein product n=1 Tax=Phytophthora lilii TaxID=2077276 RepID=A0A9W6TE30_9STRA|nr:unnamed protein product [Phytophthora lilii]